MWSVAPLLLAPVVALYGPSVGVNGTVHVQTQDTLFSLDKNGALLWQFEVPWKDPDERSWIEQHAEGVNGTVYLHVNNRDIDPRTFSGSLIALDGSDGVMKWNYTMVGLILGLPGMDMEVGVDGTVYMKICTVWHDVVGYSACMRFQTVALSSDGSLKWSLETFNPELPYDPFQGFYKFQAATQGVDGTVFLN